MICGQSRTGFFLSAACLFERAVVMSPKLIFSLNKLCETVHTGGYKCHLSLTDRAHCPVDFQYVLVPARLSLNLAP